MERNDHVRLVNKQDSEIVLKGVVYRYEYIGGTKIIGLDIDGTTTSVDLDEGDWDAEQI